MDTVKSEITAPEKKKSGWPLWIRLISLVLAVLFVLELVLVGSSKVSFSSADYVGTKQELAADYIGENDSYLTADRLRRMRSVAGALGTPKSYDEYSLFASLAIADRDYEKAIEYMNVCAEMYEGDDTNRSNIYLKLGCLWALLSGWEEAAADFETAVALNPESSSGWIMLCEAYLNSNNYEKALPALERYGQLESYTPEQQDALIQLYLTLGRTEEAIAACDRMLESPDCNKGSVLYYRAQALCLTGDFDAARTCAEECRAAGGYEFEADAIIAMCTGAQGDSESAYKAYRELAKSDKAGFDVYSQAVQYAYLCDDFEGVVELCDTAFERFGHTEETDTLKRWLGIAQVETGDYENAEKNLTAFIESEEGSAMPELNYLRGLCRMALGSFDTAAEDFTKGLENEDIYDKCLYNRGLCWLKLDEDNLAALDFQEIIVRNKDPETLQLTCDLLEIDEQGVKEIREEVAAAQAETAKPAE